MTEAVLIGIVGENGSGKSTACQLLTSFGFQTFSLSSVVREYVASLNLDGTREQLIEYSNQLKQQYGLTYFAEQCYDTVCRQGVSQVVFDSVRHPSEINFLKSKGVYFVGIEVSLEVRYQRILERRDSTDLIDFDTFKRQNEVERSGNSFGQNLSGAFELCDEIILNDADMDSLRVVLERLVDKVRRLSNV